MKKSVVIGIIIVAVVVLIAVFLSLGYRVPKSCTLDAKVCPDGSGVGRNSLKNCEFEPCPQIIKCSSTSDCPKDYTCLKKLRSEETSCYLSSQISMACIQECDSFDCNIQESDPVQIACRN